MVHWRGLALSGLGALGTSLGGAAAVWRASPPRVRDLARLQAWSGGLMLALSFVDLLPKALEEVGFARAVSWFFAGVLLFAGIVQLVPEPGPPPPGAGLGAAEGGGGAVGQASASMAEQRELSRLRARALWSGLVSALGLAIHNLPEGMAVMLSSLKGLKLGTTLAVAIALHNLPEGMAVALPVYFATGSRWKGFLWASLSGLAEPLAALLCSLAIDWARVLGGGDDADPATAWVTVDDTLAFVAGIMAFLSLAELLPQALTNARIGGELGATAEGPAGNSSADARKNAASIKGNPKRVEELATQAIVGSLFQGMAVMCLLLYIADEAL